MCLEYSAVLQPCLVMRELTIPTTHIGISSQQTMTTLSKSSGEWGFGRLNSILGFNMSQAPSPRDGMLRLYFERACDWSSYTALLLGGKSRVLVLLLRKTSHLT